MSEPSVALLGVLLARGCPVQLLDIAAGLVAARRIPSTYVEMVEMIDGIIVLAQHEADTA
jgi:hypothetical protein